jgi:hypothetical protein
MPCPKPEPKAKSKARAKRHEAAIIQQVRARCVERDGDCRLANAAHWLELGPCQGESEWAHLGDKKRFKTMGQAPEDRHMTAMTMMACTRHHDQVDRRRKPWVEVEPIDDLLGANGVLRIRQGAVSVLSVPRA